MIKIFKEGTLKTLVISCIMMLVGLLFCFVPNSSINFIEGVLSIVLIVAGTLFIFAFCLAPSDTRNFIELIEGCVLVVFGFLISAISSLFIILIGIILILIGVRDIYQCIKAKKQDSENKIGLNLNLAIICAVLGLVVVILWFFDQAKSVAIIILGIFLFIDGAIKLALLIKDIKQSGKNLRSLFSGEPKTDEAQTKIIEVDAEIKDVESTQNSESKTNSENHSENQNESNNQSKNPDDFQDFDVK